MPDYFLYFAFRRWNYFKNKVEEYADDWLKYNIHLKVCWEYQYMSLIKGKYEITK